MTSPYMFIASFFFMFNIHKMSHEGMELKLSDVKKKIKTTENEWKSLKG